MSFLIKKLFDWTNLKQQIQNVFLQLLSYKFYVNSNLNNKILFCTLDPVFCFQNINNVHFVLK